MALTVADVLKLPPLDRCQLSAGAGGLQRPVTGVSVLETPRILDVLKGGELILTTGFVVKDQPDLLFDLVKGLYARAAAGMVIQTPRWLTEVPAAIRAFADAAGFPMLVLPEEHAWLDVINPVMSLIFADHGESVHRRLMAVVAGDGGLQGVVSELARLIRRNVCLFSAEGTPLAAAGPDGGSPAQPALPFAAVAPGSLGWDQAVHGLHAIRRLPRSAGTDEAVAAPVFVDGLQAVLMAREEGEPLSSLDMFALEHGARVIALEIEKRHSAAVVEQRYQDDFLLDLLFGNFRSEDELLSRGRLYGISLSGAHSVLVLEVTGSPAVPRERWLPAVRRSLRADHADATCVLLQDVLAILAGAGGAGDAADPGRAIALAQALRAELNYAAPGCVLSIGIGTPAGGPRAVSRSFEEARQSLEVGRLLWGPGRTVYFDDIGIFRLLLSGCTTEQLIGFQEHIIGELEQHDARSGGALADTLEMFLDLDNSVSQTAAGMFLHPNTVQYRLKQIRKILRLDLDSNRARLTLYAALKIRRLQRQGKLTAGGTGLI